MSARRNDSTEGILKNLKTINIPTESKKRWNANKNIYACEKTEKKGKTRKWGRKNAPI